MKHPYQKVGIIGSGSFGTTISLLLSNNVEEVLIYTRRPNILAAINTDKFHKGVQIPHNVYATQSLEEIAAKCTLIFPIVPAKNFRTLMQEFSPYLKPYHLLIHGTKGLDSEYLKDLKGLAGRKHIHTMSEVIMQETNVLRIGCLSGPNLSKEIMEGQPTATVIASRFDEVKKAGKTVLKGKRFKVYTTSDIVGAELAGALKNIISLAAGILGGLNLGYNLWGVLMTKGLAEMIHFGKALGTQVDPFLGVAGIGDLVATASSQKSRNYKVGYRLAQGETLSEIIADMEEIAEGVSTTKIIREVAQYYNISAPITDMIYRILYEDFDIERAINFLINYPYSIDVDFL